MEYKNLLVERNGHVMTVTLNRPKKRNALSIALMKEIINLADELQEDTETRAVVFTGADKFFSAGMDLVDPTQASKVSASVLIKQRAANVGPRMIRTLTQINQITIAAINRGALGGAACIVSALDFRIGADDCFVSYPEINLGMSLSWLGLPLCVHLVGPARAKRLVILGRKEKAQTLLDWGFLDEVVPSDKVMDRALEMAEEYAAQPPIAAQMIKRSVNAISSALDQAIMHMDSDQLLLAQTTGDFREGIASFFEKRKPDFKGE